MAFKPNFNFEKAERDRAKALKKQEKLQRQQDETAKRKAAGAQASDQGSDSLSENRDES